MTARTIPTSLQRDLALRELLLSFFLETLTGAELSEWLTGIGQDSRGTIEERKSRIRAKTNYLTMAESEFPAQTEANLAPYDAGYLEELCERLSVPTSGNKDALYRRIMREVHYREGWLSRRDQSDAAALDAATVMPFLGWMPLKKRGNSENDYYPVIRDELEEVFTSVYEQLAIAHGTTLKIDFHVGDPTGHGVGVEVKMPTNNADVQRALGQIDQYQRRYQDNLILLVLQEFLKPEVERFMQEELQRKGVRAVFR